MNGDNNGNKEREAWETWREGIQARKLEQEIKDKTERAGSFLAWTVLLMAGSVIAFLAFLIWRTKLALFIVGALVVVTALAALMTAAAVSNLVKAKEKEQKP